MNQRLEVALPEGARIVIGSMASAGYGTLLVGGTVRDALLRRAVSDVDVATDARIEDVRDLLKRLPWVDSMWDTGAEFGTIGVAASGAKLEITTLRGDATAGPDLETKFAADALLRDFTINAIGLAMPDATIVDPLDGRADIAARVLRAPGDPASRFREDPIRVLRLGRFVAELGYDADPETIDAAKAFVTDLRRCASERIHSELWRLLGAPGAARGLRVLRNIGALAVLLPEARADDEAFAEVGRVPADPERRFAALLDGTDEGDLRALCERLRCSRAQARRVRYFLRYGLDADPDAKGPHSPIGGNAIISELGVAPGPLVGLVKTALAEAVGDGLLDPDDREAALDMAKTVLGMNQPAQAKGDVT